MRIHWLCPCGVRRTRCNVHRVAKQGGFTKAKARRLQGFKGTERPAPVSGKRRRHAKKTRPEEEAEESSKRFRTVDLGSEGGAQTKSVWRPKAGSKLAAKFPHLVQG